MATTTRSTKDSVFCDLFEKPEYLLQLYKALHPEDTDVTEDMLQDATIHNVLTDRMYNDLGFVVRDKLLILVEAQSTWSVNIVIRAFMYLAQSYQDRFERLHENIYGSRPISLPEPEIYVIYSGDREDHPETLSLSELFFGGKNTTLDVRVRMLYGEDRHTIIGQYVRFCKVFNMQRKLYGNSVETILETIRICKDEDVLKAYLTAHETEATDIMMTLFDDATIIENYGYEQRIEGKAEGKAEGKVEGKAEERINIIREMQKRIPSAEQISYLLNIPIDEVNAALATPV